jgi:hypothetical protein
VPRLLATNSVEFRAFDALGLEYAPAGGLRKLSGDTIRQLGRDRSSTPTKSRYRFVLPLWDVPRLQHRPPAGALETAVHLARISDYFALDPDHLLAAWAPSSTRVSRIAAAAEFADRQVLATAMRTSLKSDCIPISAVASVVAERAVPSYAFAYSALENAIRDFSMPLKDPVRSAFTNLETAFKAAVTGKLRAAEQADATRNLLTFTAADLAQKWFSQLSVVQAAHRILAGNHPGDWDGDCDPDALIKFLTAFKKLQGLA